MRNEHPAGAVVPRQLKEALRRDHRVSAEPLKVFVEKGRVVLDGAVRTYRRKLAAIRIAERHAPHLPVEDRIRIVERSPVDDRAAALGVRSRLRADDDVTHETIAVRARNGRVCLTGLTATMWERLKAENIALASPGVRSVRNLLVVDAQGLQRDAARGRALERRLREALGPASEGIQVTVSGPRIVLHGEVSGGWYRERAGQLARLEGAHRLRNRIAVRGS